MSSSNPFGNFLGNLLLLARYAPDPDIFADFLSRITGHQFVRRTDENGTAAAGKDAPASSPIDCQSAACIGTVSHESQSDNNTLNNIIPKKTTASQRSAPTSSDIFAADVLVFMNPSDVNF